jgi:hypothetical protein
VIRERLNDAGRVVTVNDSDYFVTTQFVRAHLVSDHELKRAVLFVFRKRAWPLLITAGTSDEWTYQAALDEAMAAVRRDESGTESGFAGLEGEGSTRSR